jgi:integrase
MNDSVAAAVADFLAHQRALGRKYHTEEATLRLLLKFTSQHGAVGLRDLTPGLLDAFIASRPRARARSFNHLVGVVGCFLDWTVAQRRLQASPLRTTRRRVTDQRLPFLFDAAQARRLLAAAAVLPDNSRAIGRGPTYHAIFALCYGLGLRAGEACGLRLGDVDAKRQLLVVRGGKFGKSRLIPHGPRIGELLARQTRHRNGSSDAPCLASTAGAASARAARARSSAGSPPSSPSRSPTASHRPISTASGTRSRSGACCGGIGRAPTRRRGSTSSRPSWATSTLHPRPST